MLPPLAPLPRRLIFDILWRMSMDQPTESDLILRDLWNALLPEVTP